MTFPPIPGHKLYSALEGSQHTDLGERGLLFLPDEGRCNHLHFMVCTLNANAKSTNLLSFPGLGRVG